MITRLLLSAALVAGAAFAVGTDEAQASPSTRAMTQTGLQFGPRIHIGVGVTVPFGHRHVRRSHVHEVVEYVGGYYETRTRSVRVPGAQIGWDLHGHALYGPDRIERREYQVWVPRRRVVRHVRHRTRGYYRRPVGRISVGGRVRVR